MRPSYLLIASIALVLLREGWLPPSTQADELTPRPRPSKPGSLQITNWVQRVLAPPQRKTFHLTYPVLGSLPSYLGLGSVTPALRVRGLSTVVATAHKGNGFFEGGFAFAEGYALADDGVILFWEMQRETNLLIDDMKGEVRYYDARDATIEAAPAVVPIREVWPNVQDIQRVIMHPRWKVLGVEGIKGVLLETLSHGSGTVVKTFNEFLTSFDALRLQAQSDMVGGKKRENPVDDPVMYLTGAFVTAQHEVLVWDLYLRHVLVQDGRGSMLWVAPRGN